MRPTPYLVLLALATGACDRASAPPRQGEATTPDEVDAAPATASAPVKAFDRTHRGEPAPAHGFADAAGRTVTLASFRGAPVLVNLWATWCAPCIKELPTLDAVAARGLKVVALSQDSDAAKAQAFLKTRGFKALGGYTDPRMQWLGPVATTLPTTILYDREGREVWRWTGDADWTGPEATKALAEAA